MVDQQAFFDLLDIMESEKVVEPKRFFDLMCRMSGVVNLIYLDAARGTSGLNVHRLHHTFGSDFEHTYRKRGFNRIDPVLKLTLGGIRPVEWSLARKRHPDSEPLFRALDEHGLPAEGLAFPLVGRGRRSAMLSINIDVRPEQWPAYRRNHIRDFQHLASLFHASLIEGEIDPPASEPDIVGLSYRETEVLAWAAAGKSYWEIGIILGISERTVRFFMANARQKLNVVSNTQAVAEAVWRNLIPHF